MTRAGETRTRIAAWVVWSAVGLVVSVTVAATAAVALIGRDADLFGHLFGVGALLWPMIGAIIVRRQPGNRLGWVMVGIGVLVAVSAGFELYVIFGLEVRPGSLPRPDIVLALAEGWWVPFIGLMGTFQVLLFPDGQLPSPRWRGWAWFCAIAIVVVYVALLLLPADFAHLGYPQLSNPLAVDALAPFQQVVLALIITLPIAIVGCVVGLVQRFRRSRGLERLQLKWFVATGVLVAVVYLALMLLSLPYSGSDAEEPAWLATASAVGVLTFLLIPVAVAVAILRYRLYEIDVLINRALVYTLLTAALTATYLLVVTGLQAVLRPLTGGSDLAVAGATLAVAALFRPLRTRVQTLIDRRFYRARYDAVRTLDTFTSRLRDQVEVGAVTQELTQVVARAVHPTHVSLWLREHERS